MTDQEQNIVIELPEDLRAEIEKNVAKLNEELQEKKDDLVTSPTYSFTEAINIPKVYKLNHLTEVPTAEFLIDLINSIRVHVQADTDVYENHTHMFEEA
ncbi:hypothetical protein KAR91_85860 [Candidatus Pacearchaeota archaeon]|nr:hypothetical protein [Candidatus Pacearchaeota archaeon]